MKFTLNKITEAQKKIVTEFYDTHYEVGVIESLIDHLSHVLKCTIGGKLVGIVPIGKLKYIKDSNRRSCSKEHYRLHRVVVHKDHRRKGICNALVRMSVKKLIGIGAKRIRVTKSSTNFVKPHILTNMKFRVHMYEPDEPEFKYTYELVTKFVVNKWGEYE